MIFGKYINKYYLKNAPILILGLAALILVDYFQLFIPELYRMVINGMNGDTVLVNGQAAVFDMEFLLDQVCRYVDDFINSHRYIDCNSAVCRNCHEMNIHIIRGLLLDCTSLVKSLFTAETFSFEECMALKQKYDIAGVWFDSSRIEDSRNAPPLSFGCNFSREQMTGIVACANAYHLFCVSTLRIEDMEALFACKENFCIRVNNIRHVAVLFDALLENTFILPHWQSVLDKGRFLLSKDGTRYVTASSLSSALSAARNNITSANLGIRKAISRLKI